MKQVFNLILFFVLFVQQPAFSIHPNIRNYPRKVSRAGTQSWDIIQHKNGWVYFANNKGLLEYDGNRWTTYPIKNATNVRSLYYDEQTDRIYAGAYNEFGYYKKNDAGIMKYHTLSDNVNFKERNFKEIWHINKIDDALFFQGDEVLFRYKENKMLRFSFPNYISYSAVVNNTLFISTHEGVSFLSGNLFMKLPNADILKNKKICSILPFKNNKILFVTDFSGLYVFNGERVESYKTDIDAFLSQNQVFCAAGKGTKIAFGTVRNGLVVKDFQDDTNFFSNTFSGLQNNTILSIAFDRQDNLWLGLDKGIDYALINSPVYELMGNSQLYGSGYTSIVRNNILYLGTNQGLYTTAYPLPKDPDQFKIKLLPNIQGQVWSLRLIDNLIFCGTDHGAYIFDGNRVTQLKGGSGTLRFLALQSKPDCILGSSYKGFYIIKKIKGIWQFSNYVTGFEVTGNNFEEDKEGHIWFCDWTKGISRLTFSEDLNRFDKVERFDFSKGFSSNGNNKIFKIRDQIVFSTQKGYFRYNIANKKIVKYHELNRIFGVSSYSKRLFENAKGDIWCVSNTFIGSAILQPSGQMLIDTLSYSPLKNKFISGYEHINFINDSNLIVSTDNGFSWLDLSKISKKKSSFNISISNVYLISGNDSAVNIYQSGKKSDQIPTFDYKNNSIRFEYVAPEYRSEESVTYSYILENYDSKWSNFSSVNMKEYSKLEKGSYTFRVIAKSLFETKTVETSYHFVIMPPWYESNISFIIYFILFVILVFKLFEVIKSDSDKVALKMEAQKELELKEQESKFMIEAKEKKKEIVELKNQRLRYDLRHKAQELANSTMNLIHKNEILSDMNLHIANVAVKITEESDSKTILKQLARMQESIKKNIDQDNNWKLFSENFDLVYENYLKRLSESYPNLTIGDKKICAYLKMNLNSKEIAHLLNMSYRSVEMSRHRLRKKMEIDRNINLTDLLQNF